MEEKQKKEDEEWRRLREDGSKAKKNQSNVAYDIMTLQYSQDADGQQQKYLDDMGTNDSLVVFPKILNSLFPVLIRSEVSRNAADKHARCERRHEGILQYHQWGRPSSSAVAPKTIE